MAEISEDQIMKMSGKRKKKHTKKETKRYNIMILLYPAAAITVDTPFFCTWIGMGGRK